MATITGTSGNDVLTGTDEDDVLTGLAGDDTLNGGAGSDLLLPGTGSDIINGGSGDDTLRLSLISDAFGSSASFDGGSGFDTLDASEAVVSLRFSSSPTLFWTVSSSFVYVENVQIRNTERFVLSSRNDIFSAGSSTSAFTLSGGAGG